MPNKTSCYIVQYFNWINQSHPPIIKKASIDVNDMTFFFYCPAIFIDVSFRPSCFFFSPASIFYMQYPLYPIGHCGTGLHLFSCTVVQKMWTCNLDWPAYKQTGHWLIRPLSSQFMKVLTSFPLPSLSLCVDLPDFLFSLI